MSNHPSLGSHCRAYKEVQQDRDFAPLVAHYVERLLEQGYLPSTRAAYLRVLSHFLHWLKRCDHATSQISADLVERFLNRHLPACKCASWCGRQHATAHMALARLQEMLHEEGWIPSRRTSTAEVLEAELAAFDHYLLEVCGLTEATRKFYRHSVRKLLQGQTGKSGIHMPMAQQVRRFIREFSVHRKPMSVCSMAAALRSYFRFKSLDGTVVEPLIQAIPHVMRWRLSSLPRTLTEKEVERLLEAFDLSCTKGLRDYAMLRCLTDWGLRAAEVARLQLDDIDWRAGIVNVPGKGQRRQVLPLTRTAGLAIAQYLRRGRPAIQSRCVFARLRAPVNKPITSKTVAAAMGEAAARCGLSDRLRGTHILRHSIATHLVQRGTPFKVIADILRHRSLNTTAIYAKVDLPALKGVALPWPGGQQP